MDEIVNIVDPLYENFTLPVSGILEHQYVTRIMGVGLSAIPPQWVRGEHFGGQCDLSQFEHCCGVAHLAQLVIGKAGVRVPEFIVAAFLHDISQPAFAHIGERQMRGYEPWTRAAQMVLEPSLAALIQKAGADPQGVAAIIRGEGPYSPLLTGAVSLDHVDGTLRYATRYGVFQQQVYNALDIAKAFVRTPSGWALDAAAVSHLERWRFVMDRNCKLGVRVRCLGRVALLHKALTAYQTEKGDIGRVLSGTDWSAVDRMRQVESSARYIKMLDTNAPFYHVGDISGDCPDDRTLRARVASQIKVPPEAILIEGTRTARTDRISALLTDGKTFDATTVVPALLRVYSLEQPPRKGDPEAWCQST